MNGKTNLAADAASRNPTLQNKFNLLDADFTGSFLFALLINNICHLITITLKEIKKKDIINIKGIGG